MTIKKKKQYELDQMFVPTLLNHRFHSKFIKCLDM